MKHLIPLVYFCILLTGTLYSCKNKNNKPETPLETEAATEITTLAPINPYLANGSYALPHFNSAQTNTFIAAVKKDNYQVYSGILQEIMPVILPSITLNTPDEKYYWLPGANAIFYINVDAGHFLPMARLALSPNDNEQTQETALKTYAEKNYTTGDSLKIALNTLLGPIANQPLASLSLVDKDNTLFTIHNNDLLALSLVDQKVPAKGIEISKQLKLTDLMDKTDRLLGLRMLYDGNLLLNTQNGIFCVVSRDSLKIKNHLQIVPLQHFFGTPAIDEKNGIYALSDSLIMKLVWNGINLSLNAMDGAWNYPITYERDSLLIAKGGGVMSAPVLMGFGNDPDKLVVISDGSKRANLLAFWRDELPSDSIKNKKDRLAGKIAVNCGNYSGNDSSFLQTYHPLSICGYGAFFVNTINGYPTPRTATDFALLGSIIPCPKGVERFEWDYKNDRWLSIWSEPEVRTSGVQPAISYDSKLVLVNSFDSDNAVTGWLIQGFDWSTGSLANQIIFSSNTQYGNGMNGFFQFMPNGDLIFNSIGGSYRIAFGDDPGVNKAPRL